MDSTIQVYMAKGKPQSSPVVAIWSSRGPRCIVVVPHRLDISPSVALAVRAPGVTMAATMRHPLVPRLSTDGSAHRTPMGRGKEAHRER